MFWDIYIYMDLLHWFYNYYFLIAILFKTIRGDPFLDHISLILAGFILIVIGFQLVSLGLLGEMMIKKENKDGYEIRQKIGF